MATYEQIQKANEQIQTITLSRTDKKTGKTVTKEYAEVNQRIKAFRMVYPEGAIMTEMLSNENGVCVFRAVVYTDNNKLIGTGTAYEKENAGFINQGSYIENCETSAVGRALGMAGFGIDTSVASADEVQNAVANDKIDDIKYRALLEKCKNDGVDTEKLTQLYGLKGLFEMTELQHSNAINHWKEVMERCGI